MQQQQHKHNRERKGKERCEERERGENHKLNTGTSGYVPPASSHLSYHAVPGAPHQLAVLAVGDQVEVVGELDGPGQLLQDVDAEALAAQLGVGLRVADDAVDRRVFAYINISNKC